MTTTLDRIHQRREALGLTEAELCRRAGLATNTLAQAKLTGGNFKIETIQAFAVAFKCTVGALLGEAAPAPAAAGGDGALQHIALAKLEFSPLNPRTIAAGDEARQGLVDSIAANGLLEPLLVRPVDLHYEIIAGARRLAALRTLAEAGTLPGDHLVPCHIRPVDDAEFIILAATENLARHDMHPLDEALVFRQLRDKAKMTVPQIVARLGVPQRTVERRLSLLRLSAPVQDAFRAGQLDGAQAAAFSLGEPADQLRVLKQALKDPDDYMADPENIRREMVRERTAASRVAFDLAAYKGEVLEDQLTGERWLTDSKQVNRLNADLLAAKLAELKKTYAWASRISEGDRYKYRPCKATDTGAGAVVCIDYHGKLVVMAPVLKPSEKRVASGANSGAAKAAKEREKKQQEEVALRERRKAAIGAAMMADPRRGWAIALGQMIGMSFDSKLPKLAVFDLAPVRALAKAGYSGRDKFAPAVKALIDAPQPNVLAGVLAALIEQMFEDYLEDEEIAALESLLPKLAKPAAPAKPTAAKKKAA